MPANNTHGRVLPDFRVNLIDPELADLQSGAQAQDRLRQRGAGMAPDFNEIAELMAEMPMFTVDRQQDVSNFNRLQQEFLQKGLNDPLYMFSEEGRTFINKFSRYKNDPQRSRRSQEFEQAKKLFGDNPELHGAIHVTQDGRITAQPIGPNGEYIPLTVTDAYQIKDQALGSDQGQRFTLEQTSFDDARKTIQETFSKAGTDSLAQELGFENGLVLQEILQENNSRQLSNLLENMIQQGAIDQRHFNALIAEGAREVYQPGMTPADLSAAARERAYDYIKNFATGAEKLKQQYGYKKSPLDDIMNSQRQRLVNQSYMASIFREPLDVANMQVGNYSITAPVTTADNSLLTEFNTKGVKGVDGKASTALRDNELFRDSDGLRRMQFYKVGADHPADIAKYSDIGDQKVRERLQDIIANRGFLDPGGQARMWTKVLDSEGNFATELTERYAALQRAIKTGEIPEGQTIESLNEAFQVELNEGNHYLQSVIDTEIIIPIDDGVPIFGVGKDSNSIEDYLSEELNAELLSGGEFDDRWAEFQRVNPIAAEETYRMWNSSELYRVAVSIPVPNSHSRLAHIEQNTRGSGQSPQTAEVESFAYSNPLVRNSILQPKNNSTKGNSVEDLYE